MRLREGLSLVHGAAACAAMALGHCGAMLAVAGAAWWGLPVRHEAMAALAVAALGWVGWRALRCGHRHPAVGHMATSLALAAFTVSALHGSGLALVPMLALCRAAFGA